MMRGRNHTSSLNLKGLETPSIINNKAVLNVLLVERHHIIIEFPQMIDHKRWNMCRRG